jgi:transposase
VIVVGIDPHMQTHTAVALDGATAADCGGITVRARTQGHERLLCWARSLDQERIFAVEDCRHVSGALERDLIRAGERVVRVSPKLMAHTRRSARTRGKSDPIDAASVARAAVSNPGLPTAHLPGPEREIALLTTYRDRLVAQRTQLQNELRWFVHDLDPDLAPPPRALDRAVHLRRLTVALGRLAPDVQIQVCLELVERIGELTARVRGLERDLQARVRATAPALLEIPGCAALTAAKIVAETANASRFRSEACFAMHAGVAPLEASSGTRNRHRLNRRGNRQLNAALHRIAVTQMRVHDPAKDYMARKKAQGMSRMEALRCLKRQIARSVYRTLTTPAEPLTATAA